MALQRFVDPVFSFLAESQLQGVITVGGLGLYLSDHTGAGFNNGYRQIAALGSEESGHS
jgi:hypothetical protein